MTTKLTREHAISGTPVKVANNEMKSTSYVATGTADKSQAGSRSCVRGIYEMLTQFNFSYPIFD
jgi:hypothetical protein